MKDIKRLLKQKERQLSQNQIKSAAETCRILADLYFDMGEKEKALVEYEEEANIYKKLKKDLDYIQAIRKISETHLSLECHENAIKYANEYISIAKSKHFIVELQRATTTLGRCYLDRYITHFNAEKLSEDSKEDLRLAEKHFRKSLDLIKDLVVNKREKVEMQATLYLNIALVKEYCQELEESIVNIEIAIDLCKSGQLYSLLHKSLIECAHVYVKKPDISEALSVLKEAYQNAKRLKDKKEKMCETLLTKAVLMIKEGEFLGAKQALKKAYRIQTPVEVDRENIEKKLKALVTICKYEDQLVVTNSNDHEKRKGLFEKLGDCTCILKEFPKAIDFYKKALESAILNGESERQLIPIYVSLYTTLNDNQQHSEALVYLWKEYEINKEEPEEAQQTLKDIALTMEKQWFLKKESQRDEKIFWDIVAIYERAWSAVKSLDNKELEKPIVECLLKFCRVSKMESTYKYHEKEANSRGISFDSEELVKNSEDLVENSENMGIADPEEIDLDQLSSDPESSGDEAITRENTVRRPRKKIAMKKNAKGETPLHLACINGNLQMVKMCVEQGHPINIKDNTNWLPLHEASNNGRLEILEYLLDNGAQVAINASGDNGVTALMDACTNGHFVIANLLLDRGAKAHMKTESGETALDFLEAHFEPRKQFYDEHEQGMYNQLHARIQEQCQKVGVDPRGSSTSSSSKSTLSGGSRRSGILSKGHVIEEDVVDLQSRYSSSSSDDDERCGVKEYKSAIKQLKNRRKTVVPSYPVEETKRKPFLEPHEVDLDSWLDDDLGPSRKKQKFFSDAMTNPTPIKESSRFNICDSDISASKSFSTFTRKNSKSILVESDDDVIPDYDSSDSNSRDAFDLLMNNENSRKSFTKLQKSKSGSGYVGGTVKRASQSSLLDAGFSRFQEISDDFSSSPVKNIQKSPDSTSNVMNYSQHNLSGGFREANTSGGVREREKQIIIKVQVLEEKIIVPIKEDSIHDLKISWLMEQAAKRYCFLKGKTPELKLVTTDGATLLSTDPIDVILSLTDDNFIQSEILDIKVSALPDRYLQACSDLKRSVDPQIIQLLDLNQAYQNLELSNQNLNSTNARPILKALQCQECLTTLDLSNNFLQNEGVKYLAQSIQTLPQLKSLNLTGNFITEKGLELLNNVAGKNLALLELTELNLSFNPLKNCWKFLGNFLHSSNFTTLILKSCEMQEVAGRDLNLTNLKCLDVSYNHFSAEAINSLLALLNPHRIESLNLEAAMESKGLQFPGDSWTALKDLNLTKLKLSETQILDILRNLEACDNFKVLNLSYLENLTSLTLKYILTNMTGKLDTVRMVGCKIFQNVENLSIQENSHKTDRLKLNLFLSLATKLSEDAKNAYLENLKIMWDQPFGSYGRIKVWKNIVKLYVETENQEDDFPGCFVK